MNPFAPRPGATDPTPTAVLIAAWARLANQRSAARHPLSIKPSLIAGTTHGARDAAQLSRRTDRRPAHRDATQQGYEMQNIQHAFSHFLTSLPQLVRSARAAIIKLPRPVRAPRRDASQTPVTASASRTPTFGRALRRGGLAATATLALAACGEDPLRYATPPAATQARQPIAYSRVGIREVSLPTYAALEEITVVQPDGALSSTPDSLWADDPAREVTLSVTRTLSQATGATVAAEPWPFRDVPDATVDIRIERMLAEADGRFRLAGQYYVAPEAFGSPERSRLFDLSVPYVAGGGYSAIAAARAQAITDLALLIAREGLR